MSDWLPPGATAQSALSVASLTITIPTNVITDDLLELACSATSNVTWPTLTGWTTQATQAQSTSLSGVVYTKAAVSADAGATVTVNFTGSSQRCAAVMRVYRGSAGIVDVAVTTASGSSATPQAPAVTTTTDGDTITPIVMQRIPQGNTTGSWTDPVGYGNKLAACSTFGSNANAAIATYGKLQATHGLNAAVDVPSAFSGAWVAFTVAIRPGSPTGVVRVISEIQSFTESVDGFVGSHGPQVEGLSEVVAWGDDSQQTLTVIGGPSPSTTTELFISGNWVDVTGYVSLSPGDGYHIDGGRDRQFDTVNPRTLSLVLDNRDGRFTAGNPTLVGGGLNPLYPYIAPNVPIRVTRYSGTLTGRRFTGYVDQWPTTWQGGLLAEVKITATDGFKLLARRTLKPLWLEEVLSHSPRAIYTFGEAVGDTLFASLAGPNVELGLSASPRGAALFGEPGPFLTGETALTILPATGADATSGAYAPFFKPQVTDLPFTLGVWLKTTEMGGVIYHQSYKAHALGENDAHVRGGDFDAVLFGRGFATGSVGIVIDSGTFFTPIKSWAESSVSVNDGQWHRVHGGCTANGEPFVYVDGVDVSVIVFDNANSFVGLGGDSTELFGNRDTNAFYNGSASTFTIYDRVLSVDEALDEFLSGSGFSGDRSDERIARIAGWAGVTALNLDVGVASVGPQDTNGKSALAAMREVEQSEIGTLFYDGNGTLTFHNRLHTSALTPLVLNGADIDSDFSVVSDETLLVDQVTVTGIDVGPLTRGAAKPEFPDQVDTLLTTVPALASFAYYWLTHRANTDPRSPVIGLDPLTEPDLATASILLEIGQLVDVAGLPPEAGTVPTQVVESISEVIDADTWHLSLTTAKADLVKVMVWGKFHWGDGSVWA